MPAIERTIVVDGSIDQVWDYLSDFTNTEEWDPPTQRTVRSSGEGGVGTVYLNTSRILGHDTDVEYTVVEHEAPRVLRLQGEATGMKLTDTITLSEAAGQVTVNYRAEFSPQGAAKIATPLLPVGLKKLGDDAAETMAACLRRLPGRSVD